MAQLVKNPPPMWEAWAGSLGWEDLLEKGKVTQSSILAWRIPWTVIVHGAAKRQMRLSNYFIHQTVCVCVCVCVCAHARSVVSNSLQARGL